MSTIIKAADAQPQLSGQTIQPVVFRFGDMADQATAYVDQVRQQAAQVVRAAEAQAETIRKKAEQDGRQAAVAAAREVFETRVRQQLETLLPALQTAIEQIHNARHTYLNHWHQRIVGLAAAIAERIIRRELKQQPEITLDLVKEALDLAAGSADMTLRLNPTDHQHLGKQVERLAAELAQLGPTNIVADPDISSGGCRLETRFGSIDQQIEAQLARIEEELT